MIYMPAPTTFPNGELATVARELYLEARGTITMRQAIEKARLTTKA